MRAVEDAGQVGLDDLVPLVGAELRDGSEEADPGVVDEDVEPRRFFDGELHEACDFLVATNIARGAVRAKAGRAKLVDGVGDVLLATCGEDHGSSGLGELFGDGAADAAGGAGDEGDFVG